jgi:lysophospholipid acyltransferase
MYGQLVTFLVSSFWHGFYGGYYLSFMLWFAHMITSQVVFKESKKEKSPWARWYKKSGVAGKIAVWLASNVTFTVCGIFFQVLSLKQGIRILQGLYFVPVFLYAAVYLIFGMGGTRERK